MKNKTNRTPKRVFIRCWSDEFADTIEIPCADLDHARELRDEINEGALADHLEER